MKFDFTALKNSIAGVQRGIRDLEQKLEKLMDERQRLDTAPLPRSDVEEQISAWLDAEGVRYGKLARDHVFAHFAKPKGRCFEDPMDCPAISGIKQSNLMTREHVVPQFMFWVSRDAIEKAMLAEIEHLDFSDAGLPFRERDAAREKLDAQIREVEETLDDARTRAAQAGVRA